MDRDTAPGPAAHYRERIGRLNGQERLELAARLSEGVRDLARAGLRHRNPGASDEELRWRFAELLYGRATAERLFGTPPASVR